MNPLNSAGPASTATPQAPATPASGSPQKFTTAQITKLRKAAADFESILLSTFWKSMKDSFGGDDDDATDPAHDTLEDMGMQAMSSAVGKAGGLGLGKLILKHIAPGVPFQPAAPVPYPAKAPSTLADSKE
jgi:Rod binding domain-containing protein